MRRFLLTALLLLLFAASAQAVTIQMPEKMKPYTDNEIVILSDKAGMLSIHVTDATLTEQDVVQDYPIEAGKTVISYNALSYNDQPLRTGVYTFTAELFCDGETQTDAADSSISSPRAVVEYALPSFDTVYSEPDTAWFLDCKLSAKGTLVTEICSSDAPDTVLYSHEDASDNALKNIRVYWKGLDKKKKLLPSGEYIIRTYEKKSPDVVIENRVTLCVGAPEALPVTLTDSLYPADCDDDAVVWRKIIEPVTILDAAQTSRLKIYEKPSLNAEMIGSVFCATVAVNVLELNAGANGKFAKIGVYCNYDGEYREGYVEQRYLKTVYPNQHYGAVLDKNTQTMTIYQDGKKLGTMLVSTGLMVKGNTTAETRAGVFLTYDRLTDFHQDGYRYDYAIRIDGSNFIHQVGLTYSSSVKADFTKQRAFLGVKASHGCVRMDNLPTEESGGVNAYWCWTHFSVRTKIIIIDDTENRQALLAEIKGK